VAEELQKRFLLPYWQFALTATDANRFSIRLARQITGRPKILVFNWGYHGTVDETFITLGANGAAGPRPGNIGPPVNPAVTTKVVEFNDVDALEAALVSGDVACVLAEPAMTNVGIVHPQPGYHQALRELTREYGTLLIIDETHTICAGPGGYTRAENLDPDVLVFGKAIGGGIPGAAYGFSQEVAERVVAKHELENCDVGGIGGTLAGNALSLAAMRATLTKVLTKEAFDRYDSDGRALDQRRGQRDCGCGTALARDAARMPCGVFCLALGNRKMDRRLTMRWISNWNGSCISTP
jgi:glutamate-1-semialdehyde 2,1-aminomutase